MNLKRNLWIGAGILVLVLGLGEGRLFAQAGQPQTQKPTLDKDKQKPAGGLTPDGLAEAPKPALNPEEEAAFKAYQDVPQTDTAKKLQLGEAFAAKYPQSRYLSNVYSTMVVSYSVTGQGQKVTETGEKALAINPNDVNVLAIMSQVMSRMREADPKSSTGAQILDRAEQYARRAVDVMTTMAKPEGSTEESFATAKGQVLAMSHSALGLVDVKRGKLADAISELDQSVKVDPEPDPVNMFLLGYANEKASHFDDAVKAFSKCAEILGPMQANCKQGVEEAKKLGATQLSAPK
ncbi:MAG: hypothetical protein DMG33_04400 [Acidobacteria bacterium]|nr:MAG: hypothetical protein DMG33_04400 [Acidobacteriota bacterium]